MSTSSGMWSIAMLRAASKRHGERVASYTSAPRARSLAMVASVDPVSNTTTMSASCTASIQRSTNCSSFLQMA